MENTKLRTNWSQIIPALRGIIYSSRDKMKTIIAGSRELEQIMKTYIKKKNQTKRGKE